MLRRFWLQQCPAGPNVFGTQRTDVADPAIIADPQVFDPVMKNAVTSTTFCILGRYSAPSVCANLRRALRGFLDSWRKLHILHSGSMQSYVLRFT